MGPNGSGKTTLVRALSGILPLSRGAALVDGTPVRRWPRGDLARVLVGAPSNGVRSVNIRADKVSTTNILLALRLKDLTYNADLPLTGEELADFARAFPTLRYEVRVPTLDDLFLKLSLEP